jgi:hypothetical protein
MAAALADLDAKFRRGVLTRKSYDLSRYDAAHSTAAVEQFYREVIARRLADRPRR